MNNELIIVKDGTALLNPQVAEELANFLQVAKSIKEKTDELNQKILAEMEAKNIIGIDNEFFKISYVPATDRETFDTKKFKEDCPDVYDEYIKMSPVKSSIRTKLK